MTTITTEEVRTNLPDLLRRIADGEELVIIEGGKWVGLLAAPPDPPPTEAEIAASRAKVRDAIKQSVSMSIDEGHPPPKESSLWKLLAEDAQNGAA